MKKTTVFRSFTLSTALLTAALSATLTAPASADIIIQELFDGIAGGSDSPLDGKGDTTTTVGLTGTWFSNVAGRPMTADNFNSGQDLPGLPPDGGALGGVWKNFDNWDTNNYSTRPLSTPISFNTDQVIYFSVHLNNEGDTAAGIGLTDGVNFVSAGLSWNNAHTIDNPTVNDAGNSAYIGWGTLDTLDGAYGIRTFQGQNTVDGVGLVVGKLTLSSTGMDMLQIRSYVVGEQISDDPDSTWGTASTFDLDLEATDLLLFLNGASGTSQVDGIRFGTSYFDVTDVTPIPEPTTVGLAFAAGFGLILMTWKRRRSEIRLCCLP